MNVNTEEIMKLAKEKSIRTRNIVVETIERMKNQNKEINFSTLSKEANVSRNYLYNSEELRPIIEELRDKKDSAITHIDTKDLIIEKQKDEINKLRRELEKYSKK